jgi:hypothetical protein
MELNDENLPPIVEEVDNFILKISVVNEIGPLNIIAIVLARLTWLAKSTGCEKDYFQLLETAKEKCSDEDKKVVH